MSLLASIPAQHAEMTTSPDFGELNGFQIEPLPRTTGLAHGVRQREQIVVAGTDLDEVWRQAYDLPAARGGQPLRVLGAQVVRVRFGELRERAEHRRGVHVDVRQRGGRSGAARRARALSDRSHSTSVPAPRCLGRQGKRQTRPGPAECHR